MTKMSINCFSIGCILLMTVHLARNFNIDTVHPLVYEDPTKNDNGRESYFGYSVQYLFTRSNYESKQLKWILVGAPRSNSSYIEHRGIVEPGRLYRCSLGSVEQDKCEQVVVEKIGVDSKNDSINELFVDRKDFGWLGGTVSVTSPHDGSVAVCGHRWANRIFSGYYLMNGICYWSEHDIPMKDNFKRKVPLIARELQGTTTYFYAYGQAGFSLHMAKRPETGVEEMIIGAPGVFNWTGTVIRVSRPSQSFRLPGSVRKKRQQAANFDESFVPHPEKIKGLQPEDYFGYSVHSGMFFRDRKLFYVSGAPRAANMKGKIFVFEFAPEAESLDIRIEKEGIQMGEYFGSSVLAVDLNNDQLDDLIVGAPLFSIQPDLPVRSGDEGKAYVFINEGNGILKEKEPLTGSETKDARFGSALASIGDISSDGYKDIVIGAPYENERGAVYLYLGGPNGIHYHPKTKYWQRIAAADFPFPLKGFGISITAADYDNNKYPDLLVGSYLSSHAVVLRSQPIIKFDLTLTTSSNKINVVGGSLTLKACSKYISRTSEPSEICVAHTLHIDVYYSYPRLVLLDGKTNRTQPFVYTQVKKHNTTSCREFLLYVSGLAQDFSRPLTFRLTTEIRNSSNSKSGNCPPFPTNGIGSKAVKIGKNRNSKAVDLFCPFCPVMDKRDSNSIEYSVSFSSDCGSDEICTAELGLRAWFPEYQQNPFVIGSSNRLSLKVDVTNYEEPAYVPTLKITLPSDVRLLRQYSNCLVHSVDNTGRYTYSCSLGNTLHAPKTASMLVELDTSFILSGTEFFTVDLEAQTKSDLISRRNVTNKLSLSLPLRTEVDVTVAGNSVREQVSYLRANDSFKGSENVAFQHRYEISNKGNSSVSLMNITVRLPVSMMVDETNFPITQLISIEAKHDQQPISCSQLPPINKKSIKKIQKSKRQATFSNLMIGMDQLQLNCSTTNIICLTIVCSSGSVTSSSQISILLNSSFFLGHLLQNTDKEIITLTSDAEVTVISPSNAVQPDNHKPDITTVTTSFIPQSLTPIELASWIIPLSSIGGILLLTLLMFGLFKLGFFKRQRHSMAVANRVPTQEPTNETELDGREPSESEQLS